jgi:CBS domain-containing protein
MPIFKRYAKKSGIQVSDVMNSPAVLLKQGSKIRSAAEKMWDHKVGSLIVVDQSEKRIVGIITERDIIFCAAKGYFDNAKVVDSVMSRNVIVADSDATLESAIEKMRAHNLKHMPVVDTSGTPIGMLSVRDILDASLSLLGLFTPADLA